MGQSAETQAAAAGRVNGSESGGAQPVCVGGGSGAEFSPPPSQGFVSWRDPKSGSWYVETLDGVFEQWAHSEDLQTLLLRVSAEGRRGQGEETGGVSSSGPGGAEQDPEPKPEGRPVAPSALRLGLP